MSIPRFARSVLLLVAMLAACSDPQGPCDRANACEFKGVYLDIVAVSVVPTDGTDPVDGLPRVAPEELAVDITVVNRGDTISEPVGLRANVPYYFSSDDTVPALQPGHRWQARVALAPVQAGRMLRNSDVQQVFVRIGTIPFVQPPLDTAYSASFHLLLPALVIEVAVDTDTVVFGHTAALTLTVRNASRAVPLPADSLHLNLVSGYDHWFPVWQPAFPLPVIGPGAEYTTHAQVLAPADAGWLAGALEDYNVVACHGAVRNGYPDLLGVCGWSPTQLVGVPDLSRCAEATAVPGELVPTIATCLAWRGWAYWALDVREGYRYTADRQISVLDREGLGVTPSTYVTEWVSTLTGRVYAVVQFPGPSPALRIDEFPPGS